jgi:hypothetical protein
MIGDPTPAERRCWWANNWEAVMPADPIERADYEQQLTELAEHGPAAGMETT